MMKVNEYLKSRGIDEESNYIIAGVSKCGTTSLRRIMSDLGYKVQKMDGWFWGNAVSDQFRRKTDHKPILILRNPIQRAWSHLWYMTQNKPDISKEVYDKRLKDVSEKSYYRKHLGNWEMAIILNFEILKRCEDYPRENKTSYKPDMTTSDIRLINKYIHDIRQTCRQPK